MERQGHSANHFRNQVEQRTAEGVLRMTLPTEQQWIAAFEAEEEIRNLVQRIEGAIGPEETALILREIADELEALAS